MKKMTIFDPAIECSTDMSGLSLDLELLRVTSVIYNLKNKGVVVDRNDSASNPEAFVENNTINQMINSGGVEILPITIVDGKVVKTKQYPTNAEFCSMLDISADYLKSKSKIKVKTKSRGCNDGCC